MPVIVKSGLHVVGDFTAEIASGAISIGEVITNISGQPVTISGELITIEASGLHVLISGQSVTIESGLSVVGDFTTEVASGLHVVVGSGIFLASGQGGGGTTPAAMSGQYVIIESGIGVITVATTNVSGQPVTISGDHVYVESGAYVVVESGIGVTATVSVDSGLGVIVESGLGVVGDFTTEVASGLHVVQGKTAQLQDYFISDVDESDTGIKFYGYLDAEGSWYIMQDTSGTNFRYASSGIYASNWIDRSGIIYQTFDQEF